MNRAQYRQAEPENVCFYSNKCDYCKAFFEELKKTPYKSEFRFVCVDPSPHRPQLPSWLTKVPTLVIAGANQPLTDNQVYNWIFERKLKDGVQTDTMANEPAAFLPGEMLGGIASDSYSYMDGSETLMNFDAREGSKLFGVQDAAGGGGGTDFPLGGRQPEKSRKEKQFDDAMQRYQMERDSAVPPMVRRM